MTSPERPHRPAGLEAIIIYKLVKAVVSGCVSVAAFVALWLGAEELTQTLIDVLLDHTVRAGALRVADLLERAGTTAYVRTFALAAFADAALSAVEGLALRAGRWWAPWLVVVAAAALLPWEVLEVLRHPGWGRIAILLVNLAVVVYLLRGVQREHREKVRARHDAERGRGA